MLRALRGPVWAALGLPVELRNLAEPATVVTAPAGVDERVVVLLVGDGQVVPGREGQLVQVPR